MARSLRVASQYIEKVKLAVRRNGFPTRSYLANQLMMSRSTVTKFLNGQSVNFDYFVEICRILGLDWHEICDLYLEDENKYTSFSTEENKQKRTDWGKAPDYSVFYGRTEELTKLKQWIVTERCRIVAVLGMGGIGKTALSVNLAQKIQDEFDYVIWRGLRNAPPIEKFLTEIINFLSNQQESDLPETLEDKISRLLHYLSTSRCLLILDNFESILLSNDLAGHYREGYEEYGELIRRVGEISHQSCLMLTSREKPKEIALLETQTLPVRSLQLNGLDKTTAWEILKQKGLSDQQDSEALITLYRGNPLALYLVSAIIKDLFGGSVSNFLSMNTLFIGDLFGSLLEEQFNRLSELEKKIMYFLENQQKPVSLKQLLEHLQADVRISKVKLLDALQSLLRRSLLEKITEESEILFTIQPVMSEYIKEHIQSENITSNDR